MSKRYENKGHLSYVHEFPCCLQPKGECSGEIQAHHLLKPWDGFRGMGLKATDRNLIPLCFKHHHELHHVGNELKFFDMKFGDENWGQQVARVLWVTSPHNKDGVKDDF